MVDVLGSMLNCCVIFGPRNASSGQLKACQAAVLAQLLSLPPAPTQTWALPGMNNNLRYRVAPRINRLSRAVLRSPAKKSNLWATWQPPPPLNHLKTTKNSTNRRIRWKPSATPRSLHFFVVFFDFDRQAGEFPLLVDGNQHHVDSLIKVNKNKKRVNLETTCFNLCVN